MIRMPINERPNWQEQADEFGFKFHTLYGEKYWNESAYYQFSLEQIEKDIEDPTEEIHQMCLEVVEQVTQSEQLLEQFCIPEHAWDIVRNSFKNGDPSLYSRLDFSYNGKGHAKLLENNADTPTSIYETGFWQWLWLQDNVDSGVLPRTADQFNSLQEKLVNRFHDLHFLTPDRTLHFSCCKDTEEDRGTVQYLQDCADFANLDTDFVFIEDIGLSDKNTFSDLNNSEISWLFKLYPWEFMFDEQYGQHLHSSKVRFLEPPWKSIISNKALLPMLWQLFENHPNLLPAYFQQDMGKLVSDKGIVKKPFFSREGANISISKNATELATSHGPYGEEGYVYQQLHTLPKFNNSYTLIGSWLVNDEAAGLSIREDNSLITQDSSQFLPHIIL